jgi:iron-sulfur cluster assembly protein
MTIAFTEKAAKEFKKIVSEQRLPKDTCLRVTIKGGGCSGFTYVLDFADNPGQEDLAFESYGVHIVCDSTSYLYLDGTTIDFKDDLIARGFVFENPNAKSVCNCGTSFAV